MKKISTYLPSLIVAVLLVFTLIGSSGALLADINITAKKCISLAEKNQLENKIMSELEKNYKEKYNSTGIPADVYMSALSYEYIINFEKAYINSAFDALNFGSSLNVDYPENKDLEDSIDSFFSNYADQNDYEKDENYEIKLRSTKENAYKTIGTYCDVYKFSAMDAHGVLSRLSTLYRKRGVVTAVFILSDLILIAMLLIINRKRKTNVLYWTGISAIITGVLGAVPSIYLLAVKYFDSFSIKQPQIFTAFTSSMYKLTEAFMAVQISMVVIGISLTVVYGVVHDKRKFAETSATKFD